MLDEHDEIFVITHKVGEPGEFTMEDQWYATDIWTALEIVGEHVFPIKNVNLFDVLGRSLLVTQKRDDGTEDRVVIRTDTVYTKRLG